MENGIQRTSENEKSLMVLNNKELNNGDLLMNKDGNIYAIEIEGDKVSTYYTDSDGEKHRYGSSTIKELEYHGWIKITEKIEDIEKEAMDIINGNKKLEDLAPSETSDSSDIVPVNGKATLEALESTMQNKIAHFEAVSRVLHNKLERFHRQMLSVLENQRYQLQKIQKAIQSIELYLGINEDIIQLQEGVNGVGPLSLRQQILFMDEEIAITENQGLDFSNIELFDEWLIKPENLNRLIPEDKCIVVFRIRRNKKEYFDPYDDALNNQENRKTYFVLKNGTNVYRIWGDLIIYPRVFPGRDEMSKLYEESENSRFDREKKFEETLGMYRKHLLVLQGLIDRTQIFQPLKPGINLFNPETYSEEDIRLIYDAEFLLPSGRKSYREWKKDINSSIDRGSRIVWVKTWENASHNKDNYWHYRYTNYFRFHQGTPETGIYTVEEKKKFNSFYDLRILFLPNENYWKERKNKLSWLCGTDENEVLNYDKISLEDIEFYLHSRVDRHNYIHMIPILKYLKKQRLEEIEWEKSFVKMVVGEVYRENQRVSMEDIEKIVLEAIEWWKFKVIWKRPITKDDEKALRMIRNKVNNTLKI